MNTSFHTINYFNKILIQYIYLSYAKNDLIIIVESILDYIEFLIKFKYKTSPKNKNLLNIQNYKRNKSIQNDEKINYKMKIFNKIRNWFCLYDDYIYHIRNNTSLGKDDAIYDDDLLSDDISEIKKDELEQLKLIFKEVNFSKENLLYIVIIIMMLYFILLELRKKIYCY